MEYQLELSFICTNGSKITMIVNDAKPTLTKAEIEAAMDQIIAKNIFFCKYGELVKKAGAVMREQKVKDYKM